MAVGKVAYGVFPPPTDLEREEWRQNNKQKHTESTKILATKNVSLR